MRPRQADFALAEAMTLSAITLEAHIGAVIDVVPEATAELSRQRNDAVCERAQVRITGHGVVDLPYIVGRTTVGLTREC